MSHFDPKATLASFLVTSCFRLKSAIHPGILHMTSGKAKLMAQRTNANFIDLAEFDTNEADDAKTSNKSSQVNRRLKLHPSIPVDLA